MRRAIPLLLVSAGILACDVPTAPDMARLAPDAPAQAKASGQLASVAGSSGLDPATGEAVRLTLTARMGAGGVVAGRFRIATATETLTGTVNCLTVSGSLATAAGVLDEVGGKKARGVLIRVREELSSQKGEIPEMAGYAVGTFKKTKNACPVASITLRPTSNGNFVIRGATDVVNDPPTKG